MLNFLILFRQNQIKQSYSSSLTYQQSYAKCTSTQRFIAFKTYVIYIHIHTGVYSSTNWPPFTGGQNSILNWVLKLNPSNQKIKSNKNCLDCLERALFILFFLPLGVINKVKSPFQITLQRTKRVRGRRLFLQYFLTVPIFQIILIQNKTLNLCVSGGLERSLFTFWH